MRLIDADDFQRLYEHNLDIGNYFGTAADDALEACPTIDAEPVVRCKDCKHYDYINRFNSKTGKFRKVGSCKRIYWFYAGMSKGDFCSYGERKEDVDEAD